jgi:hypothetical protein
MKCFAKIQEMIIESLECRKNGKHWIDRRANIFRSLRVLRFAGYVLVSHYA